MNNKDIFLLTPGTIRKRFKQFFAPQLIQKGFIYKKGVWVRKMGEIFQVIGTDSVCIRTFVSPFWINDTSKIANHIDYKSKSARLSTCSNVNFPFEWSLFTAPEKAYEYFNEKYLVRYDTMYNLDDYIGFCLQYYDPIDVSDWALLYAAYLRGSLQFAKDFIESAFRMIYDDYYNRQKKQVEEAYVKIRTFLDHHPDGDTIICQAREAYDLVRKSLGQHLDSDTIKCQIRDAQRYREMGLPTDNYDDFVHGLSPEAVAQKAADLDSIKVRSVQFQQVQKALQTNNYDFSDVLEFRKKNSIIMRDLILSEYGLEFSTD